LRAFGKDCLFRDKEVINRPMLTSGYGDNVFFTKIYYLFYFLLGYTIASIRGKYQ
jgi:hypothetical protein